GQAGAPPARPQPDDGPARPGAAGGALPRRVRQASLAPQLKHSAERHTEDTGPPAERDAEEVRSRMASLQRGWQRGREENAAGDEGHGDTAPRGTSKEDGR
ncbi:histidine kinase, partial [Streptomyces sp. NPDC055058]